MNESTEEKLNSNEGVFLYKSGVISINELDCLTEK